MFLYAPSYRKALKSPLRISRRGPFDKLRDRLGFCDSPQGGSDYTVERVGALTFHYLVAAEHSEAALGDINITPYPVFWHPVCVW